MSYITAGTHVPCSFSRGRWNTASRPIVRKVKRSQKPAMPPQVSWGQMFLHPVLLQKCTKCIQRSLTLPVFLDPCWLRSYCLHRCASQRPHLWKHDHATDVPVSSIIQHREIISRTEMKTDWDFVNLRLCCICHYEHCFFSGLSFHQEVNSINSQSQEVFL